MALVKCPECGREKVSDSAEMCPDCGYGIKAHYDKLKQEENEKRLAEEREQQRLIETERQQQLEKKREQWKQETINKYFGSPIKKIAWTVAVLAIFVVIIATSAAEEAKKCSLSSCNEYKTEGSEYCKEHTCKEEGCYSSKSKYDSYCYTHEAEHLCSYSGCESYKIDGGEYCYSHTCEESGCYNQKGYGSDYCTTHQVDMRKKLGNEFSFRVNSAGGIELDFRAKNNSGKEIKYIRFDVEFRNAVGDKIQDEITDDYSVSVEVVGPIKSGNSAKFKDIIGYNDNCARIDIEEVTIIYTDGTSQTGHYGWYNQK